MATDEPKDEQTEDQEKQAERDLSKDRKSEDGVTVEEESEQSFPASDPPSY